MPDIRNCKRCGKIFNYLGGLPICEVCKEADEADFRRVKEYLYENPGATMSEISTVLDMSVEKIKAYLRDGRLEIINGDGNMVLECELCGKAISTGRFCSECSKGITDKFKMTAAQMNSEISHTNNPKRNIEMRYLKKNDNR